ncbi:MAG TPA: SRPBCC family protein [Chloroflexota bacterium]|nr:SRPBCC family protein [Chloroflexota bacterium]
MPEFERTTTVPASPDDAFRVLADPRNLPRYVATMTTSEPTGADRLHVAADVEGRHEEGDARFRADREQRRMEWGGESSRGYRGWIQVAGAGDGASVTIHLFVEHTGDEEEINRVLDESVGNIRRLLS